MRAILAKARCAVCGRSLTVHQQVSGETCGDARCKHRRLKSKLQADAERTARIRAMLTVVRDRAASRLGLEEGPLPIAALPSNDRALTPLSRERCAEFRDYLVESIAEAGRREEIDQPLEEVDPRLASSPTGAEKTVMGHGCATCRGHCCEAGAHHAFLHPEQMRKQMRRHPELNRAELLERYLALLPARTYGGSCVYHAQHGCALPRESRSEICNAYYCSGLSDLWQGMAGSARPRGFVGAVANDRIVRSALIDERQSRPFPGRTEAPRASARARVE